MTSWNVSAGKSVGHRRAVLLWRAMESWLSWFGVLATSKVISGRVPSCDSAHSWRLYSAAPLGNQWRGNGADEGKIKLAQGSVR